MTVDPRSREGSDSGRSDSPDRVVAFSDGVFAIIITILVLEVGVCANGPPHRLMPTPSRDGSFARRRLRPLLSGPRSVHRITVPRSRAFNTTRTRGAQRDLGVVGPSRELGRAAPGSNWSRPDPGSGIRRPGAGAAPVLRSK
jgi:hypothetical protein